MIFIKHLIHPISMLIQNNIYVSILFCHPYHVSHSYNNYFYKEIIIKSL